MFSNNFEIVSVIVPVFNTPVALLQECIASVCGQTYTNVELLLIDDGSRKELAQYCDGIARSDDRIHVFHQQNSGVSAARNLGLDMAQGDWVTFLDSDDELTSDFLEHAVLIGNYYSADIVFGRVSYREQDGVVRESPRWYCGEEDVRTYSTRDDLDDIEKHILSSLSVCGSNVAETIQIGPCAKLIRRAILADTRFDVDVFISEDRLFNALALEQAKKVACCDEVWYVVNHHSDSTTRNFDVNSWIAGLRSAATFPLRAEMQNALLVGCCLQSMDGVGRMIERDGLLVGWRAMNLARIDDVIGWKTVIRLEEYGLAAHRKLLMGLAACDARFLVFVLLSTKAVLKRLMGLMR